MKKLPDKPSELLLLAMQDLEKVEADPSYKIDMDIWHSRTDGSAPCVVCFAGAVMAKTLAISPRKTYWPDMGIFSDDTTNKLNALNKFRVGNLRAAFYFLNISVPKSLRDYASRAVCTSLASHGSEWKNEMITLIGILQAERL